MCLVWSLLALAFTPVVSPSASGKQGQTNGTKYEAHLVSRNRGTEEQRNRGTKQTLSTGDWTGSPPGSTRDHGVRKQAQPIQGTKVRAARSITCFVAVVAAAKPSIHSVSVQRSAERDVNQPDGVGVPLPFPPRDSTSGMQRMQKHRGRRVRRRRSRLALGVRNAQCRRRAVDIWPDFASAVRRCKRGASLPDVENASH